MRSQERGAALVVVMVVLTLLFPMALMVAALTAARQRQVNAYRETLAREIAVRAALDVAISRLASRRIGLRPGEARPLQVPALSNPVRLQVTRQPDVLVTLDGQILASHQSFGLDPNQIGLDGDGRIVYHYRRLEIYLVEAEASGAGPAAPVRLLGVLGRLANGRVLSLGYRRDRAHALPPA
jgi:hypothetical protein